MNNSLVYLRYLKYTNIPKQNRECPSYVSKMNSPINFHLGDSEEGGVTSSLPLLPVPLTRGDSNFSSFIWMKIICIR